MDNGDDSYDRMPRVSGRDVRRRVRLVVMHRVPSRVFPKFDRGDWMRCLSHPKCDLSWWQHEPERVCLSVRLLRRPDLKLRGMFAREVSRAAGGGKRNVSDLRGRLPVRLAWRLLGFHFRWARQLR